MHTFKNAQSAYNSMLIGIVAITVISNSENYMRIKSEMILTNNNFIH